MLDSTMPVDQIDLSSWDFWLAPRTHREAAFAALRRHAPVTFMPETAYRGLPPGPGYWAITRYEDVVRVSRDPELFCSGRGTNIPDVPVEMAEFFGSMINLDDPRHLRLRSLVQSGFSARMVRQVETSMCRHAEAIVDDVLERHPEGECDFVGEIAAPLPLRVICDMMGVPDSDRAQVLSWTNTILGASDVELGGGLQALMEASLAMFDYAQTLARERLAHPRGDIASDLMEASIDGQRLTAAEFGSFFILLVVAGNETTRNAISHGIKALTDHPDQRTAWWEDFEAVTPTAVEEIVRWATPVIHFRRTATRDTSIRGVAIQAGDKVVLWYCSANRDEERFTDPHTLQVGRQPNPHLGFGGGGPHFCLGAGLARREIAVVFDEIRRRLPNLEVSAEPTWLQSQFVNGIKRMQCAWG